MDTCIVVDVLQRREPFFEDSYRTMQAIFNCRAKGFLTAKSFADLYYLTHRHIHDDKKTRKALSILLTTFSLLDTTGIDCRRALPSETSDYEDALMIETARREKMDCIVTRNQKDYIKSSVPVFMPKEFLSALTP